MAVNKSHEASSSSSSSRPWRYDLFLSFRGEDTRRNFTDHLFIALQNAGINNVFRDDNELRVGENISTELLEAIQDSRISLIVLSRDYAASSWCLEELAKIMECKKALNQLVFPIFYKVDPSNVRKQKCSFEEAFGKHEKRFTAEKVLRWRNALTEASNLKGFFHYTVDRHEGEFIKEIVDEILNHLNNTYLNEATYPVGLHSRVWEVNFLLSVGSNDVRIIGICAMGGMGKTTIAKSVYNNFFRCFEHKSFLANVSEISKQPNGKVHLQKQLLYDILKKKNIEVNNVDQGINMIKERLCSKRVLMVLDDVDELEQLTMLAIGKCDWFGLGSRIIITTRDEHLLKVIEADDTYMLQQLNDIESLELFSWHAFRSRHPKENYVELSKDIVRYCDGLPLALEVVGSLLYESDASDWESTSKQLREIPPKKVQEKLRISYDGLDNDKQKDIFLHVACFFIGVDKDYALAILNGCGFYAKSGISALIRKCLLKINCYNELTMHDLVRDMGREIVREECPKELGNRSRLWSHNDVLDVLQKCKGTKAVEGLILKFSMQNEESLCTKAFVNMSNLRLLQLNYVDINGSYHHFSKELRWVCWHGFPLKLIPKNFHLESIVVLDMRYSKLREFSKEIKILGKLKVLNLSHSHYLRKTPNFSKIPNLEKLELKDCTRLVEVHPSIDNLHLLVLLDMRDCKELKSLPDSICKLKALKSLNLSGCSKFERLPNDMRDMEALVELLVDKTAIRQVPTLKNIKVLSLCGCTGLASMSFGSAFWYWLSSRKSQNSVNLLGLTSLTSLTLRDCNLSDDVIPKDFGSLSSLETLDLSGNNFCCLPELPTKLSDLKANNCINLLNLPVQICKLPRLGTIEVSGCTSLHSIPELPKYLWGLKATDCPSLERLQNVSRFPYVNFSMTCSKQDKILTSCLMDDIPQIPRFIRVLYEDNIPSQFHHQSMNPWLSLTVLGYFEDAVLDLCILFYDALNPHVHFLWLTGSGGLELRNGDQLEIEIEKQPGATSTFKKLGVRVYDKSKGCLGTIQLNGVNEIIMHNSHSHSHSDSAGNSMITGGGSDNIRELSYHDNFHTTFNPDSHSAGNSMITSDESDSNYYSYSDSACASTGNSMITGDESDSDYYSDSDSDFAGNSMISTGGSGSNNTRTLSFSDNFYTTFNPIKDVRININGKCLKTL